MINLDEVATLDPSDPCPPVVVDRNPNADQVGHGRTLPLVGGERPTVYDAVFDEGRKRVYTDTMAGVLSALVPGYEALAEEFTGAEQERESATEQQQSTAAENGAGGPSAAVNAARDRVQAAVTAMFEARYEHANALRVTLQSQINAEAQTNGTWDDLDEEETEQCTLSAEGQIPVGVLVEAMLDTTDGDSLVYDKGIWMNPDVKLVVNRGDYGPFDPAFRPEPESLLSEHDPVSGRDVVYVVRWPANMVILDPTDEDTYLESLEQAGLIDVTTRPVDMPDDLYLKAVKTGRELMAVEAAAGDAD